VPGNQDFTGHNTLTFGTTTLAGAGSVTVDSHSSFTTFLRTINDGAASVGLRVDSDPGKALFGGNINIQSLNVMTRGDIEFRSTIRTSGSTRLGLNLADIPIVASIYKSVPGDLSFSAGTFTMGKHTKLTVVDGDLTIKASTATVSDLNASGRISVKAGTIKILLREPALVLLAGGGSEIDRGVDFVGNGGISFSGNIQLVGTGDTPQFAAVDPGTLQGVGAYKLFQLDAQVQFIRSGVALDGTTGSSDISSVLASAVSWAALLSELSSVGQGMSISPAVRELLEQLGIFARDLHPWELAEFGGGVPVGYDDIIRKILEDVVPSDHTVPITRLPGDLVDRVVVTYQSIFMKDGAYLDEEDLQALVGAALQGYRAAKKPEAIVPADFAAYLTAEPAPHAEALALLRGLALLFVEVAQLGLTAAEQDVSEGILIGGILPPGMTPGELIQTIRAVGATPQAR